VPPSRLFSVALTGNIASGKSTVARWFREWGAAVTDADGLVRDLQQPGIPVYDAIVRRFGRAIVAPDGSLDRPALRARVLADASARAALEAIVHPAVRARRPALEAEAAEAGFPIIVHEIPLLFETGGEGAFDRIVLVDADPATRARRLVRTRALDAPEAEQLIGAQAPTEGKRARSDYVIRNDGDLAALERAAREVWDALRRDAAAAA